MRISMIRNILLYLFENVDTEVETLEEARDFCMAMSGLSRLEKQMLRRSLTDRKALAKARAALGLGTDGTTNWRGTSRPGDGSVERADPG